MSEEVETKEAIEELRLGRLLRDLFERDNPAALIDEINRADDRVAIDGLFQLGRVASRFAQQLREGF